MSFKPYPKEKSTITSKEYRELKFKYEKKGKHKNVTQVYKGLWYQSKLEAKYAMELDYRINLGEVKSWERQVKLDLKVNGIHITNYFIDFRVEHSDGSIEYVEVKGMEMATWRVKWALLQAVRDEILEPGAELTIIKA